MLLHPFPFIWDFLLHPFFALGNSLTERKLKDKSSMLSLVSSSFPCASFTSLLVPLIYYCLKSWLPRVTVVPSPTIVVSMTSFSSIWSSSNTTISILCLDLPGKLMHRSVSLIKSLIPSVVKLPTSRWSTMSFEFRCLST